jgi:hypothetical protein
MNNKDRLINTISMVRSPTSLYRVWPYIFCEVPAKVSS